LVVLAIGCHPDDLEVSCGGTLRRYVKAGHDVYMAHTANGDMGHRIIKPDELRKIRERESIEAGKIIGAREVINIDIGDCTFRQNENLALERLVDTIKRIKPDVIITHNPEDYMEDHVRVSNLVYEASFTATISHIYEKYPPCERVSPLYYMDITGGSKFLPEEYVDITAEMEEKLDALGCHQSQLKWMKDHDGIDFLEFVRTISRFRGIQSGVQYAEGFIRAKEWPRMTTERLLP